MSKHYANPLFGVEQQVICDLSGALNGTVAATELMRYKCKRATVVTDVGVRFKVGGTDAVRKLILGLSLAGTGAVSQLGTATLGTNANATTKLLGISGTFAANDDIVISHLGTGSEPYNVQPQIFYVENFVNA